MSKKQYLLDKYPHLSNHWNFDLNINHDIDTITIGSHKEVWWTCEEGHNWLEKVKDFLKPKKVACPYCDNRKALSGYNDLATTHPELAKQWHPDNQLRVDEVTAKSVKEVMWLGECKHSWKVSIGRRVQRGEGCPYCSGRQVLAGFNDLATTHPELAAQWDPNNALSPQEVSYGSTKKISWVCPANPSHTWVASVNGRSRGNGCPVCSGRVVSSSQNDLATTDPELAAQWHPALNSTTPDKVSRGSRHLAWWVCEQGHEWQARVADRGTKSVGCPVCINKQVVPGINDLATTEPALAAQWHPSKNGALTPQQVSRGTCSPVWWQCEKGHEWTATVKNRVSLQQGCRRCNASLQSSKAERELANIIKTLLPGEEVETSVYGVIDKELDIYVPGKKFAIEFNGVYWHSEAAGKDRFYHASKQQACADQGITLYQVWEDDWNTKKDVILRGIAHRLGVISRLNEVCPALPAHWLESLGARKTKVEVVDYAAASDFLELHHIQGSARGTLYLSLVDAAGRRRAVAVFKKSSAGEGVFLIERYATAGVIPGGFTKLLKAAEKCLNPSQWVTFADLEVSNGDLYSNTGFEVEKVLAPDYSYLVNGMRRHKFGFRLKRFREDPELIFEEGLSERELAELNGIPRIWDSGKVKYVKVL